MEQLNSLPYLEGVVRESLRLYAPVSFTQRVANHDVVIPLQKPFTDKNGVLQNTVRCESLFQMQRVCWNR
jgi:Cytochrome P450